MNVVAVLAGVCGGAGVLLLVWGALLRRHELSRLAEVLDARDDAGSRHAGRATGHVGLETRLEDALVAAGWNLSARELAGLWVVASLVLAVAFALMSAKVVAGVLLGPILATAAVFFGVRLSALRRKRLVDEQLARVLVTISGMLAAGRRADSALEEAARTVGPPLGPELALVVRQYKVGVPLAEALAYAAHRLGSREFSYMVTAIEVHSEKGGDLATLLDKLAGSVASHISLRGEMRALLAEVQITRYVASAGPIAMIFLVWIASPATVKLLFTTATGFFMFVSAAALWIIGTFVIARMTRSLSKEV
ncbi:MAG: type II secretion system F family protein [Actinomycetota bacterium]|jgi:tight adherence protein B|nr:type II secretion system F family protein [Actinomycetota bacterium]